MPYIGTGRTSLFFEEAGSGGIPVLLLHELGGSSESWREVIPLLATDRRVLAVDMRCAGFQTVFVRALQWLAKRPVTFPLPSDFPTEASTVLRPLPAD